MRNNKLLTAFLLGMMFVLLFGFTRDWTESTPTDDNVANTIDDWNRYLRVDVSDRLEGMIYGFIAAETDEGFKKVIFVQESSAPSSVQADNIEVYALDDGTNCGLYAKQEDAYTKQILKKSGTSLILNCEAGDYDANSIDEDDIELDNDSYLVAINAAGTADVNLIKAGTNDLPTLPDGAEMASNAAPTEDEGIANKKYVDDGIAALVIPSGLDGLDESNGETAIGGLEIKWGKVTGISGDGSVTFTDLTGIDSAFTTKCYQVVGNEATDTTNTTPLQIDAITKTGFGYNIGSATTSLRFIAIGY